MVYSLVCEWLNDTLKDDAPEELLDDWDFKQWVDESEIKQTFKECFLSTLRSEKSINDAKDIFKSILWEYYIFRRNNNTGVLPTSNILGLTNLETYDIKKFITSEEFFLLFINQGNELIRKKIDQESSSKNDRFINNIVVKTYKRIKNVDTWSGTLAHSKLRLLCNVDGISYAGNLIMYSSKKHNVYEFNETYCRAQIEMEICDIGAVDVCQCDILHVDKFEEISGNFIYSTDNSGNFIQISNFSIQTIKRNKRWWNNIGLNEYKRFWNNIVTARRDPLYFFPKEQCLITE